MSFSDDIGRFQVRVRDVTDEIGRASLFDLFSSIILATPVDKGVLRNGWNITFDAPSNTLPVRGAPTGQAPIDRVRQALNARYTFETPQVFFTNNLPYAQRIEFDGHSQQAPEGMVRINTARWNQIVENNIRTFRR